MAAPSPLYDDDALVAEIGRFIAGAEDPRLVRNLLAAWWRYAGVRTAAGAVVDSDRFIAERSSLGLLELPASVARAVIDLEFALLNAPSKGAGPEIAPEAGPPPERTLQLVPPVEVTEAWEATPSLPAPVPIENLRAAAARVSVREEAVAEERARTAVLAGLVVFFALAIGAAIVFASMVPHLGLPGGGNPFVSPWRAWLAIVTGVAGIAIATVVARRRGAQRALAAPRIGLGGLALAGLGLLAGSVATAGAGGAVLLVASATGALRR